MDGAAQMPNVCLRTGGTTSADDASGHGFCLVPDVDTGRRLLDQPNTEANRQPRAGVDAGHEACTRQPARGGPAGWANGLGQAAQDYVERDGLEGATLRPAGGRIPR